MHLHRQAQQTSRDLRPQLLIWLIYRSKDKCFLFRKYSGKSVEFLPDFLMFQEKSPLLREIVTGDVEGVTFP